MPDPEDSGQALSPDLSLTYGPQGFTLQSYDADGNLISSELLSPEDALAMLNKQIADYTPTGVPLTMLKADGSIAATGAASTQELQEALGILLVLVTREHAGDSQAALQAIRAALSAPEAVRLVTEIPGIDPDIVSAIWPNLNDLLSGQPTGSGTEPEPEPNDQVIEGSTAQGPGPLPSSDALGRTADAGVDPGPPASTAPAAGGAGGTATAGDPVLMATGQLLVQAVDLELDGIGLDFRFARTYLHNTRYEGALGPGWDHSYNLWLREAVEPQQDGSYQYAVYRSTGRLHQDRFTSEETYQDDPGEPAGITEATFSGEAGNFDRLFKEAGRYRLLTPDGLEVHYNEDLRATLLSDRNGNQIQLSYHDANPQRLAQIVDTCGRRLEFVYDELWRLIAIHDESIDRQVLYGYDAEGRLEGVWRSVAAHVPPLRWQSYRYWADEAPAGLEGNIIGIIDSRGVELLQVQYGEEPGLVSYNRVTEQRDGGVTTFEYEYAFDVGYDPSADPLAVPMLRVTMTSPVGVPYLLEYNSQGRLLRDVVDVEAGGIIGRYETTRRYNADGLIVSEQRPDGSVVEYVHERELFEESGGEPATATAAQRARFGFLRKVIEHTIPGAQGPPQRITEFDRDPQFGLVTEQRGPFYAAATGLRLPDQPQWSVRCDYDAHGNLTALHHPNCTRADGSTQTGLTTTVVTDAQGRTRRRSIALEDGSDLVCEYEFPRAGDPTGCSPSAEIADAAGVALRRTFAYDAAGRATGVTEQFGTKTTRELDHLGRLLRQQETDPSAPPATAPRTLVNLWGVHDLPEQTRMNRVVPDGTEDTGSELIERFRFDAEGNIAATHLTSADGRVDREVEILRGADQRIRRLTADGIATIIKYDPRGLVISTTQSAGDESAMHTELAYDGAGRLQSVLDAAGNRERFEYDAFGRVARHTLASGTEERCEWDARDRLLHLAVFGAYPGAGALVCLQELWNRYDECGRLIETRTSVFDPANRQAQPPTATTTFSYDRADRLLSTMLPDGTTSTLRHDGLNRIVRAEDGAGSVATSTFDDAARTVEHLLEFSGTDDAGRSHTLRFPSRLQLDAYGRVTVITDALGNATQLERDSRDQLVAIIDPAGTRGERSFRPDGFLEEVTLAQSSTAELSYSYQLDSAGRVLSAEGPRGTVLLVERDAFGRALRTQLGPDPDDEVSTLGYDALGRVHTALDGRGVRTTVTYGPDGLPSSLEFDTSQVDPADTSLEPAPSTIAYGYDGAGRLISADDGLRPVGRRHDSRGLLISEATAAGEVQWEHDIAGQPAAFTYPDGRTLRFLRTEGRLSGIADYPPGSSPQGAGTDLLTLWAASASGFCPQRWRGTVMRTESRDLAGRLIGAVYEDLTGAEPLLTLKQICDERNLPAARVIDTPAGAQTRLFAVDGQGRLTSTSYAPLDAIDLSGLQNGPAGSTQANHDAAIAAAIAAVGSPAPEQDLYELRPDGPRERLRKLTAGAPAGETSYTSDATGLAVPTGVTRSQDASALPLSIDGVTFSYDAQRRLSRVQAAGAPAIEIARDALGRPVRLLDHHGESDITYDGLRPVTITPAGGVAATQIVCSPDDGTIVEVDTEVGPLRPLLDADGSTIALIDSSSAIVAEVERDPFGVARGPTAGFWPQFVPAFHGLPELAGAGLFLTAWRAYDPSEGDFLEPDPALFIDGLDRYCFARCNPLRFTDPSGLMAVPQGPSGRPGDPLGVSGPAFGSHRVESWWDRGFAAMYGALWGAANIFIEAVKQVTDTAAFGVAALGASTGVWSWDYHAMSGLGQMAQNDRLGTGDVFSQLAHNMADTPSRAWHAAERGDWFAFGSDALNTYMLGRSVSGLARGGGEAIFNRSVSALDRLGPAGSKLMKAIRTRQLGRMESAAMRVLGNPETKPTFVSARIAGGVGGDFNDLTGVARINPRAFTPGIRDLFVSRQNLGGSPLFRLRYQVGNLLRGNLALRTMVHEAWHQQQFLADPVGYRAVLNIPDVANPLEFTQPGSAFTGAWNVEMSTPASALSIGLGTASVMNNGAGPVQSTDGGISP